MTYSRREKAIPGSVHVQESNPTSLHKVTLSDPINSNDSKEFVSEKSDAQVDRNLDLPIALRKGTRTCTQQPLYPLSNFLSFEKFSPTHKTFCTNSTSQKRNEWLFISLYCIKCKKRRDPLFFFFF